VKLIFTLLCGIAAVTLSLLHHRSAAARLDDSLTRSAALAADLAEFSELRSKSPATSYPTGGPADLVDHVSASLHDARLEPSTLRTLTPIGPTDPTSENQRASFTLERLSLEQLGVFLSSVRAAEAGWTVTAIEIAPIMRPTNLSAAHQPLRATLTIEAPAPPAAISRQFTTQPDSARP
jgi:hypothetical protein